MVGFCLLRSVFCPPGISNEEFTISYREEYRQYPAGPAKWTRESFLHFVMLSATKV